MNKFNWNYPTTMWVGENRIKDISLACKTLNIKKPLLVTDSDLVNSEIVEKTLGNLNVTTEVYSNVKGNTLPGIIAFLFYSGSYYFLFIALFIICTIASLIEYLAFKLSYNNLIFSALIGQVISFRLIHFGYLPHQSYLLFGTIIITIFLVYLTNFFIKKMN